MTTVGHHQFHEVACDVPSGPVASVVVAATPAGDPAPIWTELERAVAAYPLERAGPENGSTAGVKAASTTGSSKQPGRTPPAGQMTSVCTPDA